MIIDKAFPAVIVTKVNLTLPYDSSVYQLLSVSVTFQPRIPNLTG